LDDASYRVMIETTTQLNLPGMELANLAGVHAMTDVTGFGLLGHLLEMCRGSGLGALLEADRVPLLPGVAALAESGIATGASNRNWQSYGKQVRALKPMSAARQAILTDPQTSGGLLVACASEELLGVQAIFERLGFTRASVIGRMIAGHGEVQIE
jgi:selenide,water dikinase